MLDLTDAQRALAAAALTIFVLWLLKPVAHRWQLVDKPLGRKDHSHATPNTGGVAMMFGVLVTAMCTLPDPGRPLVAFVLASVLVIAVGLLDDRYDLRWYWRIAGQGAAALILVYLGGVRVDNLGPLSPLADMSGGLLAVPLTVIATVGIINAVNMVDGADGLAGMLVAAALLMLLAAALYSGNLLAAQHAVILLGSVLAFLIYNARFPWQRKARIFMGNAGSAFLGLALAWMSFRLSQNPGHPVSPVLVLWFVPIPVMDCLVLMLRRLRHRKSPFAADRNHIHHVMIDGGFGPTQAAMALALFSLVCGLVAGQAMRMDVPHPVLLFAFIALCVAWYWLTSHRNRATWLFGKLYATHLLGWRKGDRRASA